MTPAIAILIIDDDLLVCESVSAWFEDDGFTVYTAASGQAALTLLDTVRIDLALVDMNLPDMSGEGLLERALVRYPESRFLIHTGSPCYRLSTELLRLGMRDEDIICKPVIGLDSFSEMIRCKIRDDRHP